MLNFIRKQQPTDFELRNPEANSAYSIRESKKAVARTALTIAAGIIVIGTGAYLLGKKLDEVVEIATDKIAEF